VAKELCTRSEANAGKLVPVEIVPAATGTPLREADASAPGLVRRRRKGIIEIDLDGGHRLRVDRDVDGQALRRVLDALAR
jgi:transposase